jgi:hypothetical protein
MTSKYGYLSVLKDAEGIGSPKWCKPYGCWHYNDRGRWTRSNGAGPDKMTYADSHVGHSVRGSDLMSLHVETDGGWHVENVASSDNQLEVCRLCGSPLALARDKAGHVIRVAGEQPQYCSESCRREVKNARARAGRRVARPPAFRPLPDLSRVDIAGIEELGIPPTKWNRLTPRTGGPIAQARHAALPAVRFIEAIRRRPRLAADRWASISRRRRTDAADRIAHLYGTGGTPKPPTLAMGWDRVTKHWRYVERKPEPGWLSNEAANVWRISQ